jgi:hypothetical protein
MDVYGFGRALGVGWHQMNMRQRLDEHPTKSESDTSEILKTIQ